MCHYCSRDTRWVLICLVCTVTHCGKASSIQLGGGGGSDVVRCRVWVLDAVYEAAREQSGPAIPLQRSFEPAVFPLSVNKHNVSLLKFQLGLALGRIRYHHPISGEDNQRQIVTVTQRTKTTDKTSIYYCFHFICTGQLNKTITITDM